MTTKCENCEFQQKIDSIERRLDYQIAIDGFKDDLIETLKSLLAYKDEVIGKLKDELTGLRN